MKTVILTGTERPSFNSRFKNRPTG